MALQMKKQYRFFATYGIFRGWEVCQGSKYEGDRKDGVFLYDQKTLSYDKVE